MNKKQSLRILLPVLATLIVLILLASLMQKNNSTHIDESVEDTLTYTVHNSGNASLFLYNPKTNEDRNLLAGINFWSVRFNADGRAIFLLGSDDEAELYTLDTKQPDSPPVNISQRLNLNIHQLRWSRDGQHLAFSSNDLEEHQQIYIWDGKAVINITPDEMNDSAESYNAVWSPDGRYLAFWLKQEDNTLIYVWDGENSFNITPDLDYNISDYRPAWSSDGRLAFIANYHIDTSIYGSDIFLWNGSTTVNLSQNPTVEYSNLGWNPNGEFAFLTRHNCDDNSHCEYNVFVWDGVSVKNGSPNVDTFTNVAPGMIGYYSSPSWTLNGNLVFISQTSQDTHAQIYIWDGQTVTNISQNPKFHNGIPHWNADGRWAFSTFFSSEQLVYVRDADNKTLLSVDGQSPALSSGGYLIFCKYRRPEWVLYMWNGQDIIEITQGHNIWAQWQSGQGTFCTSG
jgi:Tol biopolymer transport system component